ncbi:MAG TPA: ABC transporter ATP-binding protein, partial [Clostridiaceae bacterium]|nr:ABC transporter ATP-binding protein [Clostridiaceae bacterium]
DIIIDIRKMDKTILLVEQNAYKALSIADRAYILEQGRIKMEGSAKYIADNPAVREAYLGAKVQ